MDKNNKAFEGDCTNKDIKVGIYIRLSYADEDKAGGESESIINQKMLLTRYVKEKNWNLVDIYCDDGFTGTDFNRPGFKRLIDDIKRKRINTVITKDLSRLGRDYIETGYYLEKFFPENKIRYIALNDGIDTFSGNMDDDMTPFRAVINDMYSRDISRKIRSAMDIKKKSGKFIGAFAPYGYLKCPHDKNRLIIDKNTAPVIARIFGLYLSGFGYKQIASILQGEGVLTPGAYKMLHTNYRNARTKSDRWAPETIKSILTNPTYCGSVAQNKSVKVSYKSRKMISRKKDEWIVVNNTHEAIIDKETFEIVQKMIEMKTWGSCSGKDYSGRNYSGRSYVNYSGRQGNHLFSGLLYCGDCGGRMTYAKQGNGRTYCICMNHKRFNNCSWHSIPEDETEKIILDKMAQISMLSCNKEKLLEIITNKLKSKELIRSSNEYKRKQTEKRLSEIGRIVKKIYEDRVNGILAENDFAGLIREYAQERERLETELKRLLLPGMACKAGVAGDCKKEGGNGNDNVNDNGNNNESNLKDDYMKKFLHDFIGFKSPNKATLISLIKRVEIYERGKILVRFNFDSPKQIQLMHHSDI